MLAMSPAEEFSDNYSTNARLQHRRGFASRLFSFTSNYYVNINYLVHMHGTVQYSTKYNGRLNNTATSVLCTL